MRAVSTLSSSEHITSSETPSTVHTHLWQKAFFAPHQGSALSYGWRIET
jgi:hypothetical protein